MRNKIAIIAPANSIVGNKSINLIEKGNEKLNSLGFEVKYEKNIFSDKLYGYAGVIEEKIQDIASAFSGDSDVILCATGGINSNCILEYISEESFWKNVSNKVFIGNSNNIILLNFFSECYGVKCYLGPNLKSLGKYDSALSLRNFKEKILGVNQNLIFSKQPFVMNKGKCEGITFGGNGASLRRLLGTRYFPRFENKIFVLEFSSIENPPIEVLSILSQFKQVGIFDKINGLILGEYSYELSIKELIFDYIKDKEYPVIVSSDFGHNCESTFIPIGSRIEIDTIKNKYVEKK